MAKYCIGCRHHQREVGEPYICKSKLSKYSGIATHIFSTCDCWQQLRDKDIDDKHHLVEMIAEKMTEVIGNDT